MADEREFKYYELTPDEQRSLRETLLKNKRLRGIKKFVRIPGHTVDNIIYEFDGLNDNQNTRVEWLRKHIDKKFKFPPSIPTLVAFQDPQYTGQHFIVSDNPDMLEYDNAIAYFLRTNKNSNKYPTINGGKRKSKRSKKQRKYKTRKN